MLWQKFVISIKSNLNALNIYQMVIYANEDSSNDWIENCHKGARDFLSLYPNCK